MISRPIAEAYDAIFSVKAMKDIAKNSDYLDFINSFPGIDKIKSPVLIRTFHVLAANLALKEKRINERKVHLDVAQKALNEMNR